MGRKVYVGSQETDFIELSNFVDTSVADLITTDTEHNEEYTLFHNIWSNVNSAVRLFGGIIEDNGNGTVRVAGGGGMWKVEASSVEGVPAGECEPMQLNSAQGGKLFYHEWEGSPNLTLTNNAYNYIFVTWDHTFDNGDGTFGKAILHASTNFYLQDWENDPDYYAFMDAHPELNLPKRRSAMLHAFTVGRVYKMDNEITIRVCGTNGWNFNKRIQLFGEEFFPVIRARGLDIEPVADTLKFNVTEGVMWAEMANRFTVRAFNMDLGDTFTSWYQHSSTETTDTLAELGANMPYGVVHQPYDIFYSSTDDTYYRFNKGWILDTAVIDANDDGLLTLTAGTAKNYFKLEDGFTYKITLNGVTALTGNLTINIGSTIDGTDLLNDVSVADLSNETYTTTFVASGDTAYISIEGTATVDSIVATKVIDEFTELDIFLEDFEVSNVAYWSEVLDYVNSKRHVGQMADLTTIETNYPNGYTNNSEGIDYVLLQLQATDALYRYDGTRDLGDRWVFFGNKSTTHDKVVVAFIGNVEGMNNTFPNGYDEVINVIIPTADGKYYEYSGVEGNDGWVRVQGYVERNGWLRFYNQEGVDPTRYNDKTVGGLQDIPSGYYGVAWIYMVHDNTAHVVYGQDYYTNEGAKQAALPTPLPGLLAAYSTLVGKMTFTRGGTAFENAESPFLEKFISSGVSLHNDLAGLDGGSSQQNKYYHLDEEQYLGVVDILNDGIEFVKYVNVIDAPKLGKAGTLTYSVETLTIGENGVYTIPTGAYHTIL